MRFVFLITSIGLMCSAMVQESSPVLPLVFEPNRGQAPADFEYVGRTGQGTVLIGKSGMALLSATGKDAIRMKITGATPTQSEPLERQGATSNYFVGNSGMWRTAIPHYGKIKYKNIYPGIDLLYYGTGQQLEYDFILSPGRTFSVIELAFEGARKVRLDKEGNLLIDAHGRTVRQLRPRVYQNINGVQRQVAASYRVLRGSRVQFELGRYDRSRELVIDPVVQFAGYVGREGHDSAVSVVTDAAGSVYIAGSTNSTQLATSSAAQDTFAAESDAYVAKFSASGTLQFLTYFGGNRFDTGLAVGVDSAGNPYLAGVTLSSNLPASGGAQTAFGGEDDGFIAKFNSTGSRLLWATYVGGNAADWAAGMAVDSQGGAWLTGWTQSTNFPVRGAFQSGTAGGGSDVFITRVSPTGENFTYSTYFGAEGRDLGSGIAVDAQGILHITGATTSNNLPTGVAPRGTVAGDLDAFIAKLNPATNQVIYGRVLGGAGEDYGTGIAVDPAGNSYVVGHTKSPGFPATRTSAQSTFGGNTDIFVARLNGNTGATDYATFLGGNGDDWTEAIAVDAAGSAYVAGWTNSGNFPVRNPIQANYQGGGGSANQRFDAIVARLSPGGDSLLYSTYFGGAGEDKAYGVTLDPGGNVLITGTTTTPLLSGASAGLTVGAQGSTDAFLARLSADTALSLVVAQPGSIALTARLGDTAPLTSDISLTATGSSTTYTVGTNATWLSVTPESGQIPRTLRVAVNPALLPPGPSIAEVTIRSGTNSVTVPVTVNVILAPVVTSANPSALPPGQGAATVVLTGNGYTAQSVVDVNGIRVNAAFLDARNLRVTIPPELTRSEGNLNVVVINPDARSATFILNVASAVPVLSSSAVVHGATSAAGPIAPGEIVIISGTGFGPETLVQSGPGTDGRIQSTLGETTVRFDDVPAPILWVQSGRVAVVVPYSVSGRAATQLTVEFRGRRSVSLPIAVAQSSPGIFTADASGRGAASALNQDGSRNAPGNPAERGSVIVLYATGEGQVTPALPDGTPVPPSALTRPVQQVNVTIGGVAADVQYAGGAAGLVTGLMQLNVRVPEGAPQGEVPIVVTVGGQSSPAGVTVSVR